MATVVEVIEELRESMTVIEVAELIGEDHAMIGVRIGVVGEITEMIGVIRMAGTTRRSL